MLCVSIYTLRQDRPSLKHNSRIMSNTQIMCVCVHVLFYFFSFDEAMRSVSSTAGGPTDELCEVFGEMRAHLYLHTGTLLLKMAQEREQNWRAVTDFATLCFLLSYQVHANVT